SFVANLTPLTLVGRRTDTVFDGNYWSENAEPDLDGDGRSDRPYRLTSVFDHFRGNLTAADLFAQGLGASALSAAERAFPVLDAVPVEDHHPLVRPPDLPAVPAPPRRCEGAHGGGVLTASAFVAAGAAVLARGRRRGAWSPSTPSPSATARSAPWSRSTSTSPRAKSSRCSGRTAPARPRP